jgi:hypothetical protein
MFVYAVCMCVFVCVCVYFMYVCMYACLHVYSMCVCMPCMYACVHVCTDVSMDMYVFVRWSVDMCRDLPRFQLHVGMIVADVISRK